MANTVELDINSLPDDFSIRYHWSNGSLPPPYHYEYSIRLDASGNGSMSMIPDYRGNGVPEWQENFPCDQDTLNEIFQMMFEAGAFSGRLERQPQGVGGSSEWAAIVAQGTDFVIPGSVAPELREAVTLIFNRIKTAVPDVVQSKLESLRAQYVVEHYN